VGVDERNYFLGRPSSSVAKKTDAALRMSFARRSSRFSFSNAAIRAASAVDVPDRRPESISAWFTQPRSDSVPMPSSRADLEHHPHRAFAQLLRVLLRPTPLPTR